MTPEEIDKQILLATEVLFEFVLNLGNYGDPFSYESTLGRVASSNYRLGHRPAKDKFSGA